MSEKGLFSVVKDGTLEELTKKLSEGADVRGARGEDNETVLHVAASIGDVSKVRALREAGAQVDARTHDGNSVVHYAVKNDKMEVLRELVAAGANINAPNDNGDTPLHWACYRGHGEVITFLAAQPSIDVNARDHYLRTPLQSAAGKGMLAAVRTLVSRGADVNAVDRDGRSVLMDAAWSGHVQVVKELLQAGAKLQKDEDGRDAIDVLENFSGNGLPLDEGFLEMVNQLRSQVSN